MCLHVEWVDTVNPVGGHGGYPVSETDEEYEYRMAEYEYMLREEQHANWRSLLHGLPRWEERPRYECGDRCQL